MQAYRTLLLVLAVMAIAISIEPAFAQGNSANSNGNKYGIGKPGKIGELPPGQLRKSLETLPPGIQKKALQWLQEMDFPEADVESLYTTPDGDIYYADYELATPPVTVQALPGALTADSLPETELFSLHSKSGSSNVLYLDFDGHVITGTAWNASTNTPTLVALPYDPSFNDMPPTIANFTDEERKRIHEIWHRIAEDFAPFEIDVTTEEPSTFTRTTGRLLFTHDSDANGNAMPAQGAGGVAYVDVFDSYSYVSYYSPALVYYSNLSTYEFGQGDASFVAEAGSHEFGHNLNLSHDGAVAHDGIPVDAYYDGHGSGWVSWAAIMGGSYGSNVTQWSKGEYPWANNTQDDLAIIGSFLGYDGDPEGDTSSTAKAISATPFIGAIEATNPEDDPANSNNNNKGEIDSASDVDWWYVDTGAGTLDITVTPSWHAFNTSDFATYYYRGTNLDVDLELYNSSLNLLDTNDPTDETDARVSATVTAGRYYLRINGVGNSVGDGYTDYASIGQYFISGSAPPATTDGTPPSPNPMTWADLPSATGSSTIEMTANSASDASGFVEYYFDCTSGEPVGCIDSGWQPSLYYEARDLLANNSYSWTVRARDNSDNETLPSVTAIATTPTGPPVAPSNFTANAVSETQIDLNWTDSPDEAGYVLERFSNGSDGWKPIATPGAGSTFFGDSGRSSGTTYYYRLSATANGFASEYATANAKTPGVGEDPVIVTFEQRIDTASDDVEEREDGSMVLNSDYLEISDDFYFGGGLQHVGLRFQNVGVPQGATILDAYITYNSAFTHIAPARHDYAAHDVDNAPAFAGSSYNVSSRTATTATVSAFPAPWPASYVNHQSPDLSPVVQEIVDRNGWVPNNAMAVIITGQGARSAWAYEGRAARAPLLHVDYRTCSESRTFSHSWQLISLPCLPKQHTVQDIFPDLLPEEMLMNWSLWRLDPATYSYKLMGVDDVMEAKTGYWLLIFDQDYTMNVSGREVRSSTISLENSSAEGRYNMVGHPHRVAIPWKDVRFLDGENTYTLDQVDPDLGGGLGRACSQVPVDASCRVSSLMYLWNGSAWQSYNGSTPLMEGALNRFDGFLVKAFEPGLSIQIPEIPAASAEAAANSLAADKHRRGDSWFIRLIAESGNLSDPGNALGQFIESTDGHDSHDLPESKPFGRNYLTIVFPHDDWPENAWAYTSDYRSVSKKPEGDWTFKVLASEDVSEVTLRWEGPEDVLKKSWIIDEQTGKKVKVEKVGEFKFTISGGEATFRFIVK